MKDKTFAEKVFDNVVLIPALFIVTVILGVCWAGVMSFVAFKEMLKGVFYGKS